MAFSLRSNRKPPERPVIINVMLIIAGSIVFGLGVNMVLLRAGVVSSGATEVDAVVESCEGLLCNVHYERDGVDHRGRFTGRSASAGSHIELFVYDDEPQRLYLRTQAPIGVAIGFAAVGFVLLAVGGTRLFRHWRRQAVQERASPASP